jgi:2-polyprenyl-6-methoxyphenol hydroxylase-like FAD-dependent oxidoreductase
MYDAIIVGARCAGAATAMLLGRRGYRVLLLDRATLPSDLPQGHFIHKDGPRRLKDWGLLDSIVASGCGAVDVQLTDFGDFPLVARDLATDGVAWGYGPRRRVVDQLLLEAAADSGVEVRDRVVVEEFSTAGDRINGIVGRSLGGAHVAERARVVVGADGRRSSLARWVGAREYDVVPTLTCYYFSYWSEVEHEGFEAYHRNRRAVFSHPTNDSLYAVFVAWPIAELPAVRADVERQFERVVRGCGDLGERLAAGRHEERFYGATDLPNFFRTPHGPGWALVGDAGHHKDPYMALGMADALRDAEFLADAIDEMFSGTSSEEEAMRRHERRRNDAAVADYRQNLRLAAFEPVPSEWLQIRAAVRGDAEETRKMAMARVGMIPPASFFNPEHIAALMMRSGFAAT